MFVGSGIRDVLLLIAVGMWLLMILVIGHIGWIVKFAMKTWETDEPVWIKIARIATVIITPVIGFYALEALSHYRKPLADRPKVGFASWIFPVVAFGLLLWCAILATLRPNMEDHRLLGGLSMFIAILACYLAISIPHHILARVLSISRHGLFFSRVQFLPLVVIAALFSLL